jgi:hypothetical protein
VDTFSTCCDGHVFNMKQGMYNVVVRLICNYLYSPLLGTEHNVTNRDVTSNNYNTLTVVFTGRCLVAASKFLLFRARSKVQCKVPTPD